jgi:hypothetical protein
MANEIVDLLHPEFRRVKSEVDAVRKILYRILGFKLIVDAVDHFNFFIILPKKIRYKFYSALTFALSEIYTDVPL